MEGTKPKHWRAVPPAMSGTSYRADARAEGGRVDAGEPVGRVVAGAAPARRG